MSISDDVPAPADDVSGDETESHRGDATRRGYRRSGLTWKPGQKQRTSVEPGLYLDPFRAETVRYWTGTAWAPESIGMSDDPGRDAAREIQQRYGSQWKGIEVYSGAADEADELRNRPPAFTPNRAGVWIVLAVLAMAAVYGLNRHNYVGSSAHNGQIGAVIGGCYDQDLSHIVACTDSSAVWKLVKQAQTCEAPLVEGESKSSDSGSNPFCLLRLVPTS